MSSPIPYLQQSWRWFGPNDPVPLDHIRQTGATHVVTALHEIPNGAVWPMEDILRRKAQIEASGLRWSVVESVPVHEDVKQARGEIERYLANYAQTLRHLSAAGTKVVCYNFMLLMDWTRTRLDWKLADGAESSRYDAIDAAVFDLHILRRSGAEASHSPETVRCAGAKFDEMTEAECASLSRTILMGLPGTVDDFTLDEFRSRLSECEKIDSARLRENHVRFLRHVVPVAAECGISLALHPDDPPFSIFGLPRIAGSADDLTQVLAAVDSPANGLTFCTGSLGANVANHLPSLFRQVAHRVSFVHLRSVQLETNGSFFEAEHLGGSAEMPSVMRAIVQELQKRAEQGNIQPLPMRPDHGHRMLGDLQQSYYPGYSTIGRLRGLAELRGLERGIHFQMEHETSVP